MKPLSKHRKTRILRRLFNGDTYGQAAETEGVSKSTVKKVFDEFVDRAAGSSLDEAAEEYNVVNEIELLRELAVEARRANVSIPELLAATRLLALMRKLNLSPVELQEHLEMYKKHRHEFGDFVQAAMKLSRLEKETGKTFKAIIIQYEKTTSRVRRLRKDEKRLRTHVGELNEECETTLKKLEELNEKSEKAQKILDRLSITKLELVPFGLKPRDFDTVKIFLSEIGRLGGDPTKAVEILKRTSSLEAELQQKTDRFNQLKYLNGLERRSHRKKVEELEETRECLGKEISDKKETLRQLIIKESEQREKNEALAKRAKATGLRIDGLIREQATLLQVQPDIDLVSKTLPARKKELELLKQKIKEERTLITVTESIAALFAKKSYDRKAVIQWLQLTKHTKTYGPIDESVRKKMVELMAEQGFVPTEKLDAVRLDAEEKIAECKNQAETWQNIAKKRLEQLEECGKLLSAIREAKDKKLDKSIDKRIVNIIAEFAKRA